MLGQPFPAFAAFCLPWAAEDTIPTAPKKHTFAVSDFGPAAAPAAPCWQEGRGEEREGEAGQAARFLLAAVTAQRP